MAILKDSCVCAYQVNTSSDSAWTLPFARKMACDGIHIVVAPVGSSKPIMQNLLEIPQQSI